MATEQEPFGKLYILHEPLHPLARKIFAAAKLNGLRLELPPFEYGELTGTPGRFTQRTPEYRAKFPRGQAPGFESASGEFRLAESSAIAYYVSASGPRAAQLLGATPEERGRVQEWIFWHELGPALTLPELISWRLGTAAYDPQKEEAAAKVLDEHLGYLEESLTGRAWLVGDQAGPSLADLTIGASMLFACRFYVDGKMRERLPNIVAYLERLRAVDGLHDLFSIHMIEERQQPPA